MNPGVLINIIVGASAGIGAYLATRSLRKYGAGKVEELYQHLLNVGVKASLVEKTGTPDKSKRRFWPKNPIGTIKLAGRSIDSINVVGVATQYSANYYLDYIVNKLSFVITGKKRKVKMARKKTSTFRGKVNDIEWKGDELLSQVLNSDYQLKDRLLTFVESNKKVTVEIYPELKKGYVRIRTGYSLPTLALFETIDIIANHVSSEW